jgi:hypothetical protein
MRIEAARAPVHVLHGGLGHPALAGADGADHVEALLAPEHLPLDEQAFLAVGVDDHPGGALAVGGIDVLVPDVHRFEHVAVGVDDVVGASHGDLLWVGEKGPGQVGQTLPFLTIARE